MFISTEIKKEVSGVRSDQDYPYLKKKVFPSLKLIGLSKDQNSDFISSTFW